MRDERRRFLKAMALTPLAPAALGSAASAQTPPVPAPPPGVPPVSAAGSVAQALAEAVRREHGRHLDAAALEAVTKEIARSLESAARMRSALRLGNPDEPVTLFSARGRR